MSLNHESYCKKIKLINVHVFTFRTYLYRMVRSGVDAVGLLASYFQRLKVGLESSVIAVGMDGVV